MTLGAAEAEAARLGGRHTFVEGDIGDTGLVEGVLREHKTDVVVNFAAESHNRYAIVNPGAFFRTNVLGTQVSCEAARRNSNWPHP